MLKNCFYFSPEYSSAKKGNSHNVTHSKRATLLWCDAPLRIIRKKVILLPGRKQGSRKSTFVTLYFCSNSSQELPPLRNQTLHHNYHSSPVSLSHWRIFWISRAGAGSRYLSPWNNCASHFHSLVSRIKQANDKRASNQGRKKEERKHRIPSRLCYHFYFLIVIAVIIMFVSQPFFVVAHPCCTEMK